MNSVLQCSSNLYQLTNYFLNPEKNRLIENNAIIMTNSKSSSLSLSYKELIEIGKDLYSPHNFKKELEKLNQTFKDDNGGNEKDLACFIIMQIHTELNNTEPKINTYPNNNIGQQEEIIVNPYDRKQVLNYFFNEYTLKHNSIISEIFYGINQRMFECQDCKSRNMQNRNNIPLIKYNYEIFFF